VERGDKARERRWEYWDQSWSRRVDQETLKEIVGGDGYLKGTKEGQQTLRVDGEETLKGRVMERLAGEESLRGRGEGEGGKGRVVGP
jgi:hypothetical protein